ncbi:hypothetical protein [Flavobacterium sp.]|uniref:hypothetical protein n=1 Tax=Flavobacterium sp. TaxID=239 RepID=UPI0025D15FD7|nr:hypothetical protein [Flavobacterium sp.]
MKNLILLIALTLTCNIANSQSIKKKTNTKSNSVQYSEEKALELIADYYEFYNADEEYDNPVVRRISNNVFYVKVEYCSGGKDICYEESNGESIKKEFFWSSKVLILKIQSSTKYTVTVKANY